MMKINNSISITLAIATSLILGCARQTNNIQPIGSYCGVSGKEYKNPFDNETIDEKVYSEISSITERTYKAESLSLLVKNEIGEDEQVMYTHGKVFSEGDTVMTTGFTKTCARGITPESSGAFQAALPVKIVIKDDLTWVAEKAVSYEIKYGTEFSSKGFLIGSVEDVSDPSPSSAIDFEFSEYIFLEQIGKLSKSQKALKTNPETALDQIFMQIKVSDSPEMFARINFRKVATPAAETPEAP